MKHFKSTMLLPGLGQEGCGISTGSLMSRQQLVTTKLTAQRSGCSLSTLSCQPALGIDAQGHPGGLGQGTGRRDMGLWGRCLTPDTLVSDETAKQRGSLHTASRPGLLPAFAPPAPAGDRAPAASGQGPGYPALPGLVCRQGILLGSPQPSHLPCDRLSTGLGGLRHGANAGARGAPRREQAAVVQPWQQSRLPAAQGTVGRATAEPLRPRDGAGRWRASHPGVHPGEPTRASSPCKCPFVPNSSWTLSLPSPPAHHTPRSRQGRSPLKKATKPHTE